MDKIKIRPSGNKSRFGYRGPKQRYAVYKAEWNQKWLPLEEGKVKELCEEHNLNLDDFVDEEDSPNRKWTYALIRIERFIHNPNFPNILRSGKSPFYRC